MFFVFDRCTINMGKLTLFFPLIGATIVGKTTTEYMCMSGSSWTSCTGPILNPHDVTRVSGGSSSGCAVLVGIVYMQW